MTDDNEHPLLDRIRWVSEWYFVDPVDGKAYASDDPLDAADRIEQLEAALREIARLRTDLSGDFSLGSKQSDIARKALNGAA